MLLLLTINVAKLQSELERIRDESGLFGNILSSDEGLVIIDAINLENYDSTLISAMAASMITENHFGFSNPNEIILSYDTERIIINKFYIQKKDVELLLISIIPPVMRYFKRCLNKSIKLVNKIF